MQAPLQTAPVQALRNTRSSRGLRVDGPKPPLVRSIHSLAIAALIAGAFVCAGVAALAQSGATMITIEKAKAGAPPADFDFARTGQGGPVQWAVVADTT